MSTKKKVEDFYDQYTVNQIKVQKNLRHFLIVSFLKDHGLRKNSRVLEIGCGIGALSELIFKNIPNGSFAGVDISPKSIEIAQKRFEKHKNASFFVNDMSDFTYEDSFDFIVLPDVLEHIPEDQHAHIFKTIAGLSSEKGQIFVNIPTPEHNAYLEKHEPDKLQVIDLQLSIGKMVTHAENNGFILDKYERYSIFRVEKDYVRLLFTRKKELDYRQMRPLWKRIPQKFFHRFVK